MVKKGVGSDHVWRFKAIIRTRERESILEPERGCEWGDTAGVATTWSNTDVSMGILTGWRQDYMRLNCRCNTGHCDREGKGADLMSLARPHHASSQADLSTLRNPAMLPILRNPLGRGKIQAFLKVRWDDSVWMVGNSA